MTITILQWNIWYQEDIHHIVEFLRDHPADIICLQELKVDGAGQPESHAPSYLAAQLGLHYHIQEVPPTEENIHYNFATGVFSKFPIIATKYAWINQPDGSGGYEDTFRAYVEAKLELPDGTELAVGTTRLSYTHGFTGTPRKTAETQQLLTHLSQHQSRLVFAGNLNATPASETIELLSQQLKSVGPNLLEPTWTTKPFADQEFSASSLGWRLDYIFTTPDIVTESTEIIPTVYSDHLPVIARLSIGS